LKTSRNTQKLQKTEHSGYQVENSVEHEGKQGVHRAYPAVPKGETSALEYGTLERILARENMQNAFKRVVANKGSHGVDGMKIDELREFLKQNWLDIKASILQGTYKPKPVRRVEIPKPNGGTRLLGIPTVLDRLIQQAIAQELSLIFEKGFSNNSFGFRHGRSAKDAVKQANAYINEGYTWVVDLDLEKFFDRVNHDILMSRISRKIKDKRVLKLIRGYLTSGVMLNGVKIKNEKGTPQGGPLSPLLANIILDDLDKELERRGHKFCRYADDCNIFVKSERAAHRVRESITKYIEDTLKLKVNMEKSAVDRPWKRKFLGFSFYTAKGKSNIRIAKSSIDKFKKKVKEITSRSNPIGIEERIILLNQTTVGWVNYFSLAKAKSHMEDLDKWIRRRLRMCIWKQWKRVRTRIRNLIKLGMNPYFAKIYANTRKGYWHIANSHILSTTLTNEYLISLGYKSLTAQYSKMHVN
jgi:RNA-directed DNA polymerase